MTIIVTGANAPLIHHLERAFRRWAPDVTDVKFRPRRAWTGVRDELNGSAQRYVVVPGDRLPIVRGDVKPDSDVFIVWPDHLTIWHSGEEFDYPPEVYADSDPAFARVLNTIQMAKRHRGPKFGPKGES